MSWLAFEGQLGEPLGSTRIWGSVGCPYLPCSMPTLKCIPHIWPLQAPFGVRGSNRS